MAWLAGFDRHLEEAMGAARVATPPQINVVGTAIFLLAVGLMLGNVMLQRRRTKGAT